MSRDNPNFAALDWLIGAINETLAQARQQLETFASDSSITEPSATAPAQSLLTSCLNSIHQVHGSLHMANLTGAAMLAEEMEQLVQALANGNVENNDETREFLMRALLELPLYLDKIAFQRRDNAVLLLPLLNDLRAVRRERLITEGMLFSPDLSALQQVPAGRRAPAADCAQLQHQVAKLRKIYHLAGAGLIRDINRKDCLSYLVKVSEKMSLLYSGSRRQQLWEILLGLFEGIADQRINMPPALRQLLRRIDVEFRLLQGQGARVLEVQLDSKLICNLLFYIYLCGPNGPRTKLLYDKFALDKAVPGTPRPDTEDLRAMDPDTMADAIAALREELQTIRESLDPSTASDKRPLASDIIAVAKRLADTLGVLGLENQRARASSVHALLGDASRSAEPGELLMQAAAELVRLDAGLAAAAERDTIINCESPLEGDAIETLLREARIGLDMVKESIEEYIANQWDISYLSRVPARLQEVCGVLEMVGYHSAAKIISACKDYIQQQLIGTDVEPESQRLDSLADAITSIEYYLERHADGIEDFDTLMALAQDSVAALGYAAPLSTTNAVDNNPQALATPASPTETEVLEHLEYAQEPQREVLAESAAAEAQKEQSWFTINPQTNQTGTGIDRQQTTPEPPIERVSGPKVSEADNSALIDAEIIEIFLEEAGQVLKNISHHLPEWAANFSNRNALIECRRGFHTLKGSGRMVDALAVAELSWAVENMLNRILDESMSSLRVHAVLMEKVWQKLPSMIEAFRHRSGDPEAQITAQLTVWANQLAGGQVPAELNSATASSALKEHAGTQQLADSRDEHDQLWEIFAQEAETHLATVADFLTQMRLAAPLYVVPSDALHRALHTLKGSAHMAEVKPVAELVAPLEHFVKELRTYQVPIIEDIFDLIEDAVSYVRAALAQIHAGQPLQIDKGEQFTARVAELQERAVGHLIRASESGEQRPVDPQLLALIMTEGMDVLLEADQMLSEWRATPDERPPLQPVIAELELLKRAASQAQLPILQELAQLLLGVYQQVISGHLEEEPALWAALEQGHNELLDLIDAVAATQDLPQLNAAVAEALRALADGDAAVLTEDDFDLSEFGIDKAEFGPLQAPRAAASNNTPGSQSFEQLLPTQLERAAATIDTPVSPQPPVSKSWGKDLETPCDEAITVNQPVVSESLEDPIFESESVSISGAGHAADKTEGSTASENENSTAEQALLADIDPEVVEIFLEEASDLADELEELIQRWEQEPANAIHAEGLKRVLHTFKGCARMAGLMGLGEVAHRFESVIESIADNSQPHAEFFADAHGIYDRMATATETISAWLTGEQTHAFCQLLQLSWADSQLAEDANAVDYGLAADDLELPDTPQANSGDQLTAVDAEVDAGEAEARIHEGLAATAEPTPGGSNLLPFVRSSGGLNQRDCAGAANRGQPQEMVRVSSELLEELVNLAGETAISRSRLEEQVGEFGTALEEMDSTLLRLNEQLRRLEKETEAQILFRQEQLAEQDDTFDPLEMDRYSSIQQLSRSLLESTSDLLELRGTLDNRARDTETLLLQQSRVNTELQEGLMRSRMVPFARLVPRLRRIVRQISAELNKQVELVFSNVEGELDRSMLERIVAPLEHMLRNAVDHGIETPALRRECGKPERGRITLTLAREGGEVVLTISDDGAGINLMRVRKTAVARGLMRAGAEVSNRDLAQFILQPGFSTADQVTQISGRGVGMDIVSAEIKQIGGTVSFNSQVGEGTEFVVRLPFTVSVNRALMVKVGDDVFALPLNTIEGIVRLSPFNLEHYYRSPTALFEYAGEPYQVNYFGTLLQSNAQPKLNTEEMQLPVLLVRAENTAMALQVDSILDSREIVVKSLGPQFATLQGVSGATVTGDGTVVVILDTHALLRKQSALLARLHTPLMVERTEREPPEAQKLVMVVDDSVTVRKVTTRFLEREGYLVTTAKDGQDALIQLQNLIPDVILLDIEMPRMDGFEVARYIRSSSRLRDVPVVMVTSRTGKKHREYGLSLGVNHYLGKPYQEEVLLSVIRQYIDTPALAH